MEQVMQIYLKNQQIYHSYYVTVVHRSDNDFIHIELLDARMRKMFNATEITYTGANGFKKIPAYENPLLRSTLTSLDSMIVRIQQIVNDQMTKEITGEQYSWQN